MSAATQSSLALVDKITAQVAGLSMNGPAAAAGGAAASGASFIPTETKDKRWWPTIPPGHTAYTFFGVDAEHPNGVINAEAATPAAAAAPASASAQPAAASTNATPAPKAEKPKAEKAKADKPAGGDKKAAAAPKAGAAAEPDQPDFTKLDIRVGQIVKAARHPDPKVESLYVEQIDCGDATGPRQVLSGLVKYIPLEQFQTMRVCVITNLKAGNLMGEMSYGMVLAASRGEGDARVVELVQPPVGSKPGDKIVVLDSSVDYSAFEPMAEVDGKKRNKKTNTFDNPWSRTAETLKTNEKLEATWNGMLIGTKEHGPCKAPSLANAQIA